MAHETTTSNATKAPTTSSTGQQTATQASQRDGDGASSTHSVRPRLGAGSALPSSKSPELTGDESGDVADNEHSSDDGESDQESKCEVAASENPDSSKGDMAEFESLEALAALRASKMMLEDGDDSSD